jgi:hypothetical protein
MASSGLAELFDGNTLLQRLLEARFPPSFSMDKLTCAFPRLCSNIMNWKISHWNYATGIFLFRIKPRPSINPALSFWRSQKSRFP